MLKPSLHTQNLGASPGPGAQEAHHQTETRMLPESHLGGEGDTEGEGLKERQGIPHGMKTQCTIQSPYLQVENINITAFGAKSKRREELSRQIALNSTSF